MAMIRSAVKSSLTAEAAGRLLRPTYANGPILAHGLAYRDGSLDLLVLFRDNVVYRYTFADNLSASLWLDLWQDDLHDECYEPIDWLRQLRLFRQEGLILPCKDRV